MAGGISIHGVDIARGVPASGLAVELWRIDGTRTRIASGVLGPGGAFDDPTSRGSGIEAGEYEVIFHVGDFLRGAGSALTHPAFLEMVPFRFHVADVEAHYHLPFKFTAWGFSLFRGS